MSSITVASPFVRQALDGARDAGCDIEQILADSAIPERVLSEQKSRISMQQYVDLSQTLTRTLADEAWGLLDRSHKPGSLKVVGFSTIDTKTVGESMSRMVECRNIIESSFIHQLDIEEQTVTYKLHKTSPLCAKNTYIVENALMTFHRYHSWLAKKLIPIKQVTLNYPPPDFAKEYRHLFYSSPVLFNQEQVSIQFESSSLKLANKRSSDDLEGYIQNYPRDFFLNLTDATDMLGDIRQFVEKHIRDHNLPPEIGAVAEHLSLHPQTFRRRLKNEGTVYLTLKSEVRRDMAINYLNQGELSVEEIGFKVGFSEASAFIKAFKSWTGLTPLTYRRG